MGVETVTERADVNHARQGTCRGRPLHASGLHRPPVGGEVASSRERAGHAPWTPRVHTPRERAGHATGTPREPRTTRRTRGGSSGPQGSVRSADPVRPRAGNGTSRSAYETTHRPVPVQGPGGTEHDLETEGCGTPRRGRPHPGPTRTQPAVRAVRCWCVRACVRGGCGC